MTHVSLANIRRHPAHRLTISGLSQGIAQAFSIAPGLVRCIWVIGRSIMVIAACMKIRAFSQRDEM